MECEYRCLRALIKTCVPLLCSLLSSTLFTMILQLHEMSVLVSSGHGCFTNGDAVAKV